MVRATMCRLQVRTKGNPSGYTANLTRGVPQGAPSSPVYFNAYIDNLPCEARRRAGSEANDTGAVTFLADDVLLQALTRQTLQNLLYVASWWSKQKDATWSIQKCSNLQPDGRRQETVYLNRQAFKPSPSETYLGMTLTAAGFKDVKFVTREKAAGPETGGLTNSSWWSLALRHTISDLLLR